MLPRAFNLSEDSVSCRACGATHASPNKNQWGLCDSCITKFTYRNSHQKLTDEAITAHLAQELVLTAKRIASGKLIGRCEAVSSWSYKGLPSVGYQCAHLAVTTRKGRRLCTLHSKSSSPKFCGDKKSNPYEVVTVLIREVAAKDSRFRVAIEEALK